MPLPMSRSILLSVCRPTLFDGTAQLSLPINSTSFSVQDPSVLYALSFAIVENDTAWFVVVVVL